jgi:hypothetical protein
MKPNIANNKGHAYGTALGSVTLCMKNHYGTWEPDQTHTDLANLIFKMNKSDPIIGGTPPRQQLCIVDSLFCNKSDITGTPELMPGYLVMGTFAPAVDYQTVKKIRVGVSGLKHDEAKIDPYLTSFGYKTSDVQWIVVAPGGGTSDAGVAGSGGAGSGGSSGAGGNSAGSATNTGGGKGSGGGRGSGGVNAGGTDGANASGGRKGSGGASATGGGSGDASGGAAGLGGAGAGGHGGLGGTTVSAGDSSAGLGGAVTGSSGSGPGTSSNGCGCNVGGHGSRGLSVTMVAGTILAGQLRRLLLRRDNRNQTKESA